MRTIFFSLPTKKLLTINVIAITKLNDARVIRRCSEDEIICSGMKDVKTKFEVKRMVKTTMLTRKSRFVIKMPSFNMLMALEKLPIVY